METAYKRELRRKEEGMGVLAFLFGRMVLVVRAVMASGFGAHRSNPEYGTATRCSPPLPATPTNRRSLPVVTLFLQLSYMAQTYIIADTRILASW